MSLLEVSFEEFCRPKEVRFSLHILEEIDECTNTLSLLSSQRQVNLTAVLDKWQVGSCTVPAFCSLPGFIFFLVDLSINFFDAENNHLKSSQGNQEPNHISQKRQGEQLWRTVRCIAILLDGLLRKRATHNDQTERPKKCALSPNKITSNFFR